MVLLLFMMILQSLFHCLLCYPQLISSKQINLDVWAEVIRRSCVELAKIHVILDFHTFHGGLQYHQGWYEGYSTGTPVGWNKLDKVPFGCWHGLYPSDIYVNIGKYIFLHEKQSVCAYYNIKAGTDKYFCQNVLKDGYDGFITVYPPVKNENNPMFNYELTVCNDNCGKVTFNNTCAPITYRYGSHAELLCNCDDSYYNLNCGGDYVVISDEVSANNTIRQQIARERFEEQYKRRLLLSTNTIESSNKKKYITNFNNSNFNQQYKCFMRYKDVDYLRVKEIPKNKAISINIVFITQLLSSKIDKFYDKFYDKMMTLNSALDHNVQRMLILDYELNTHHYNHNMSGNQHIIDDSYVYNLDYSLDVLRNKSYYQVYEQWISPWNLTSSSAIPAAQLNNEDKRKPYLYTNINILQTTETFVFSNTLIGLIVYNIHHKGTILYEIKRWIHFQAKCLRKIGTDIIIVIGNGDNQFNEEILDTCSHIISFILGIDHNNNNHHNSDTINLDVRSSHRIIQLPNSHRRDSKITEHYAHINLIYHENFFNISTMLSEII